MPPPTPRALAYFHARGRSIGSLARTRRDPPRATARAIRAGSRSISPALHAPTRRRQEPETDADARGAAHRADAAQRIGFAPFATPREPAARAREAFDVLSPGCAAARRVLPAASMRIAALALVLVACGGAPDGEPAPTSEPPAATTTTPPAPDAPPAATPPAAGTPPAAPPPPAPDVHAIPWQTGASIGAGVAFKDTKNPTGENVFIGYAGYEVTLASAEAWVAALYDAALASRGVRWLYAVKGPQDPGYDAQEIGNSHVASALVGGQISASTNVVIVTGHSSGSFVADELLEQLATGADPSGLTANKIVFFDLDGGQKYVSDAALARLKKHWYVGAHDGATLSPNHGDMQTFAAPNGTFFDYDAGGSGCNAGANWCVHVSLVITKPHDPSTGDPVHDYSDFAGRPVNHAWLDLLK